MCSVDKQVSTSRRIINVGILVSMCVCIRKEMFTFCEEAVKIIFVIHTRILKKEKCNIRSYEIPAHLHVLVICVLIRIMIS